MECNPKSEEYIQKSERFRIESEAREREQVENLKNFMLSRGLDAARTLADHFDYPDPEIQLNASKAFLGHALKVSGLEANRVEFTKPLEFKPYDPLEGERA